jgi:hypothetical protein
MGFTKGQRVVSTNPDGVVYRGVVEVQRRGWVMIDLDEPCETPQGWQAARVMLKASTVSLATD